MIEKLADVDDVIADKFLNDQQRPRPRSWQQSARNDCHEHLPGHLRIGVQEQGRTAAAGCGRGLSSVSARYSAGHRHWTKGEEVVRKTSDSEPFAAVAFKIMTDPFVGQLTFIRSIPGR